MTPRTNTVLSDLTGDELFALVGTDFLKSLVTARTKIRAELAARAADGDDRRSPNEARIFELEGQVSWHKATADHAHIELEEAVAELKTLQGLVRYIEDCDPVLLDEARQRVPVVESPGTLI